MRDQEERSLLKAYHQLDADKRQYLRTLLACASQPEVLAFPVTEAGRSHLLACLQGDIDPKTRECYAEKSKG